MKSREIVFISLKEKCKTSRIFSVFYILIFLTVSWLLLHINKHKEETKPLERIVDLNYINQIRFKIVIFIQLNPSYNSWV